jgi:hypothetical protein
MGVDLDVKKCSACKQLKPLDDFTTARRMKSDLSSSCKECFNVYRRVWMQIHPDKSLEYAIRKIEKNKR